MVNQPPTNTMTEQPVVYDNLNLVPPARATLKGVNLNLEQINQIVQYAYAYADKNGLEQPDWGNAKNRFMSDYTISLDGNSWVAFPSSNGNTQSTEEEK